MAADLAVLACGGALPVQILEAHPDAVGFSLKGVPHLLGDAAEEHQIEKMGALFAAIKAAGCTRFVLAGGLARPALNPAEMDAETLRIAPRLMAALQQGDDQLLRQVIEIFEEQNLKVVGAYELLPALTAAEGFQVGAGPGTQDMQDAIRGFDILDALSPLDVGQGCAVSGGQCIGIETLQGTDALLRFVAETRPGSTTGGVFVKAAKRGQDLRVDMPAIGPDTVSAVVRAGLSGIVIEANRVMILEREATLAAVEQAGLFLAARTS